MGGGGTPTADIESVIFICRGWYGSIRRPGVNSVGVRYADGYICRGVPTDKCPKYRGDGMLAFPGGRGAGRQGLHLEDDGIMDELQGAAVGAGPIPVMREGAVKGVTGDAPPNPSWVG